MMMKELRSTIDLEDAMLIWESIVVDKYNSNIGE